MEREFKWNADAADTGRIPASALIAPLIQENGAVEMEAAYYDTADGMISGLRGGLRFRRENDKGVVCLKLAAQASYGGACKLREEFECEAADLVSGIRKLPSAGAPQELCDRLLQQELVLLGRMTFSRRTCLLAYGACTCELALDRGTMYRHDRTRPICEAELELKSGSEEDFSALALRMQNELHLEPQPLSKLARMYEL